MEALLSGCALIFFTIIISYNDIKTYKIPNIFIIMGICAGLFISVFSPYINFINSLLGIIMGILYTSVISYILFLQNKKICIGMGDVKLMGLIGAFVGMFFIPIVLLIGFLLAIFYKHYTKVTKLPFAPMLMISCIFCWGLLVWKN